jgi:hypothetical protein
VDGEGGVRRADGRAGHLSHGPYVGLTPGSYTAAFYVRREEASDMGEIEVDVCCDHGSRELARTYFAADDIRTTIAGLLRLDFRVEADARACEVRLRVPAGFIVEIRELVIFRREPSNWGIQ